MTTNSEVPGSLPDTPANGTVPAATTTQTPADSSPASPADDAGAEPADQAVKPADTEKQPDTISDAVRNVLSESRKKRDKADESPTPGQNAKGKDAEAKPKSETDESDAEGKPPPFHQHPRWKKLNADFKALEASTAAKVAELEPLAEVGRSWQKFMTDTGLSQKEVEYGQSIMALMRSAPEDALEVIEDLAVQLRVHVGKALPKDLQEKVDSGEISEEFAKKYHQERVGKTAAEARAKETEGKSVEEQTVRRDRERKAAVDEWFAQAKTKDPDFDKLTPMVNDRIAVLARARKADAGPIEPKEAVEICKQALEDVRKHIKALVPTKTAVEPKRTEHSAPGTGTSQARTAPKTMLDVTRQVLAESRGG